MLGSFFSKKIIYATKIGFIGLGKLGMPCAEAISDKGFDVAGYDIIRKSSDKIEIRESLKELVADRDIVFIATPTPHEEGYDGREPTSHKEEGLRPSFHWGEEHATAARLILTVRANATGKDIP